MTTAQLPFDPRAFDEAKASPELRAMVAEIERTAPRPVERAATVADAEAARREFASGDFPLGPASPRAELREIAGPGGPLRLRVFRPRGRVRGAMLHIHGGGWILGSPEMNDPQNEARADALGLAIASVEYRLAPEHPYPAAPDDCEAAALWLARHAREELGADPERILVGGESAGGHLAAVTCLRMRDRYGFRFRGANLVYGLYDLSGVPSHTAFDDRNLVVNSGSARWFTRCFVSDERRLRDPDVSPLYADLRGLPPALMTVGTLDPLLDHTLFLYARWVAAGSPAELAVTPGAPHGFDLYPVPEAAAARARIAAFLERCLA